jgi:hypothetical protein
VRVDVHREQLGHGGAKRSADRIPSRCRTWCRCAIFHWNRIS